MAVVIAGLQERIVKIGDLFEGMEVVAIQTERIVLKRAGLYECVYIENQRKKRRTAAQRRKSV